MTAAQRYVVDSDVFITAKNLYSAFDICPGFWRSLIRCHHQGQVFGIDRVRSELLAGQKTDDLIQWVRKEPPDGFFLEVESDAVTAVYTEIMVWVQRHPSYFDYAKAKFATGADGWLVAYAQVHGAIVVTNEQRAPESKREIKLPDVCDQFGLKPESTFSMLRALGVRLDWTEVA